MSSFRADRESVALLRASARALIDETISEPCWGLAHGLAELIEQLVSSSGKPAEYFGKEGGQVYRPEEAEFMPECCPACGEWAGQHESWCSHAHEGQAERPEPAEPAATSERPVHYFGCCPVCHEEPVLMFDAKRNEYMVCEEHRKAWCVGRGNFSAWQEMTPDDLFGQDYFLSVECEIIPTPTCTCSSSEQIPSEGEQPEWLTRGPAEPAGSGLLADGYVCRLGGRLFEFRIEYGAPILYRLSPEGEYYHAEGEICQYAYCGVAGGGYSWFAYTYTQYEGEWDIGDTQQVSLSVRDIEPVATSRQALAEAASLESLLTWLDLSGLPPVPPPEPPARKPTNWRFDGPEGGEQIPY